MTRSLTAILAVTLFTLGGVAGCAAFGKNMQKVDDTILDVSEATAETLNCVANLTKMAEMIGNKLSPTAAMSVCIALTVQKNIPQKTETTPAQPALFM
jgi:hypothetical protein